MPHLVLSKCAQGKPLIEPIKASSLVRSPIRDNSIAHAVNERSSAVYTIVIGAMGLTRKTKPICAVAIDKRWLWLARLANGHFDVDVPEIK